MGSHINLKGGPGQDQVTFDNRNDAVPRNVTVEQSQVLGLPYDGLRILPGSSQHDVETIELLLGLGDDRVTVPSLSRQVIVDGGFGDDEASALLNLNPSDSSIASYTSLITDQVESISFSNEASTSTAATYWLVALQGDGIATPVSQTLRSVDATSYADGTTSSNDHTYLSTRGATQTNIHLGNQSSAGIVDHLKVVHIDHATRIDAGAGNDELQVGPELHDIAATLQLIGGDGTNDRVVFTDRDANPKFTDAGSPVGVPHTGQLFAGLLVDPDGNELDAEFVELHETGEPEIIPIGYTGFESAEVNFLGATGNEVTVQDLVTTTAVNLGAGDDVVRLSELQSALTIDGGGHAGVGDLVEWDGALRTNALTSTFTSDATHTRFEISETVDGAPRTLIPEVRVAQVEETRLLLGSNNDRVTLDTPDSSMVVTIAGNDGDDQVIHQRIGAAGITDFAGGPGFDQLTVEIPINPTLPEYSFIDGSGASKLNFAVEELVVDNSGFDGSVTWAALLDKVQASVLGTTSDVVLTDGADEVRIRGGVGGTGQSVDSLELTEASGQVEAVIDGNHVLLKRGATILEPVEFTNIAPLQSLTFSPDETRVYGVDPTGRQALCLRCSRHRITPAGD